MFLFCRCGMKTTNQKFLPKCREKIYVLCICLITWYLRIYIFKFIIINLHRCGIYIGRLLAIYKRKRKKKSLFCHHYLPNYEKPSQSVEAKLPFRRNSAPRLTKLSPLPYYFVKAFLPNCRHKPTNLSLINFANHCVSILCMGLYNIL